MTPSHPTEPIRAATDAAYGAIPSSSMDGPGDGPLLMGGQGRTWTELQDIIESPQSVPLDGYERFMWRVLTAIAVLAALAWGALILMLIGGA